MGCADDLYQLPMAQRHAHLVRAVERALTDLFSDTSVSPEQTLEDLEVLEEKIGELVCTLEEQIEYGAVGT